MFPIYFRKNNGFSNQKREKSPALVTLLKYLPRLSSTSNKGMIIGVVFMVHALIDEQARILCLERTIRFKGVV